MLSAERHTKSTLLIDLDLSFGQVASHLNLQPKQGLLELVRDESALREAELFRTYAAVHPSGLQVIAAPAAPGFASLVTAEHVELVLARAVEAFEVIFIDAGATRDERMLAIFARSDTVVVPVVPEIPALNAVHLLLDQLSETGALGGQTLFVLNNMFAKDLLRRSRHRDRARRLHRQRPPLRPAVLPARGQRGHPGRHRQPEVGGRRQVPRARGRGAGQGRRAGRRLDQRHGPGPEEGAARPVRPALGAVPGSISRPGPQAVARPHGCQRSDTAWASGRHYA